LERTLTPSSCEGETQAAATLACGQASSPPGFFFWTAPGRGEVEAAVPGPLASFVPPEAIRLVVVLLLSFFIGLEREEHKQQEARDAFGGVRTFPLIGLVGYALAVLSGPQLFAWTLGFAVVGSFMLLSYKHKLDKHAHAGITTEMSGLATYAVGGLLARDMFWTASTIAVVCVLLLELKRALEGLTRKVGSDELVTLSQFLILTVVILPVLPNRDFTPFHLNPFKTWLVVVAVNGVSYGSYVLRRWMKQRGGVLLSAVLGGAYSSTATTLVLARQAKEETKPWLFSGSILAASAVMYVRLAGLVGVFNRELAVRLAPPFLALALAGGATGAWLSRRDADLRGKAPTEHLAKNPLELKGALLFAVIFLAILTATSLAREYLGRAGLYALAGLMGVSDVDPFILGIAQTASAASVASDAAAVVIAAASNNVAKGVYAYMFADRKTGLRALALLGGFAVAGLTPLAWLAR
jgi:uncharacterized membrane protein (DUF4010 family)